MAKRKSRQKVTKKPGLKLETRFDCPVCSHENVVHCRLNSKLKRGFANCSVCSASFSCLITNIESPIDVYHNWIDDLNSNKGMNTEFEE